MTKHNHSNNNMCNICCEDWSEKVVKTECPYCNYATCQKCLKKYLLQLFNDPKCMHPDCNKIWTVDHLFSIIPKSFITNHYKKHRESILYDREVAMLPATQPIVEREIKKRHILNEIEKLKIRRNELDNELHLLYMQHHRPNAQQSNAQQSKSVQQYSGRCGKDNCKGFVSAKSYKCGICETKHCEKCFVHHGCIDDHVCIEDDVKSFEMLRKDSKPCPTCASLIHRTSGCPMMFCTQCNTAWDWNTFKITSNEDHIHNPHYFAWRAANPGGARMMGGGGVHDCGQQLNMRRIEVACAGLRETDRKQVLSIWGFLLHLNREEMHHYNGPHVDLFDKNLDLRMKFLGNKIDEKHMKSVIHMREKASNKKREVLQILQTFYTVCQDFLTTFVQERPKNIEGLLSQFAGIVSYSDEALANVASRYNCVTPNLRKIISDRGLGF